MRARIMPLMCTMFLLTSCDGKSLGIANNISVEENATQLSFELVDFRQQGGSNCPEETAATDDTADADKDALCATVTFNYPKISSDAKPELAEQLNQFILKQLVDNSDGGEAAEIITPEQFAADFIQEYEQTPNPFNSWEMERSIRIVFTTKNMLTLLFEEHGYTGGAHPFSGARYSVLSLDDGRQITLADLLNPGYGAALNVAG